MAKPALFIETHSGDYFAEYPDMNTDKTMTNKRGLAARLKMVVAGLAVAAVLAGGATAIVDTDPVNSEDTTETAKRSRGKNRMQSFGGATVNGLSWQ